MLPNSGIKLLIVEDDFSIRKVLSEFLRLEGYEVATAENGLEALNRLSQFRPDLVISDVLMPICDGMELLRRLSEFAEPIPVLLMSGYGGEGELGDLQGYSSFIGFLPKPIQIDAMLAGLVEYFQGNGFWAPLSQAPVQRSSSSVNC